ncbi:MAG TPA: isoprenylcysteine carboxylmethyltransferase family protein [Methanospirillum sp.]|nr:isoprenylcysteine carboxylmethyltransferase family protein [Methanospirillum sp.]
MNSKNRVVLMGNEWRTRMKGLTYGLIPVLLMAALLFGSSGQFFWRMAWIFIIVHVIATIILALGVSPSLIEERSERRKGVKKWDQAMVLLLSVLGFIILLLAGLDHRFHWTDSFSLMLQISGLCMFILGYGIVINSGITNKFFSGVIRIQSDRGHHVVTEGPYQYIRHPGYFGLILCMIAEPLMFNSLWAAIPTVCAVILFLIRTYLEDCTLKDELSGYSEYSRQVRFRIIPGIW